MSQTRGSLGGLRGGLGRGGGRGPGEADRPPDDESPAVIITEELGKNPQEEMIGLEEKRVKERKLRHRIKQTPFKKLVELWRKRRRRLAL
jgi:hypothetical protein